MSAVHDVDPLRSSGAIFGPVGCSHAGRPPLTGVSCGPNLRFSTPPKVSAETVAGAWSCQVIGGGVPSMLAASVGFQPQTRQACATAERAKVSAVPYGSGPVRTSSQSRRYSPSVASQRALAGASVPSAKPSGGGYAYA